MRWPHRGVVLYAFLTMPKDHPKPRKARAPRKKTSTQERRDRVRRLEAVGKEMPFRCGRCEEKNLRCFVDTVSGRCAGCIAAQCECDLFVPEEEWERVEEEEHEKELALARAEEELARRKRELLEVQKEKRSFLLRDKKLLAAQDKTQEAEASSTTAPLPMDPFTDLGWSQANNPLLDPSLDHLLNDFFVDPSVDFGFLSPSFFGEFADDTVPLAGGSS